MHMNETQSLYMRELKKFCRNKLKHIKKPRIRKRSMVKVMAFAIAVKHLSGGMPKKIFKSGGIKNHSDQPASCFVDGGEFVINKTNDTDRK